MSSFFSNYICFVFNDHQCRIGQYALWKKNRRVLLRPMLSLAHEKIILVGSRGIPNPWVLYDGVGWPSAKLSALGELRKVVGGAL